MKLIIPKMLLAVTISMVMGCSSSNDSGNGSVVDGGSGGDPTDNGSGGTGTETGDGSSSLDSIAGADTSSQPASFDVTAMQASLEGIQGTEPVSIEAGDTVLTLLEKAQ